MAEDGQRSKVARLIETYDLGDLGEELEERWTRSEDRSSLRDLADRFNRALLRSALADHGVQTVPGEVENYYRLLTDDEVTSGDRVRAQSHLEDAGIDIEGLTDDFVSYQAIRTYLTSYRDVTAPPSTDRPADRVRSGLESIQRLESRLQSVTDGTLSDLAAAGQLTLGDFDVLVSVRVHCTDCGTQRPVADLVRSGGCTCEHP